MLLLAESLEHFVIGLWPLQIKDGDGRKLAFPLCSLFNILSSEMLWALGGDGPEGWGFGTEAPILATHHEFRVRGLKASLAWGIGEICWSRCIMILQCAHKRA